MTPVILRSRALARRLEGWATTRPPSFEARRRRLAPLDDDSEIAPRKRHAKKAYPARYHQRLGSARADGVCGAAEGRRTRTGGDHAGAGRGRAQGSKGDPVLLDGSSRRRETGPGF